MPGRNIGVGALVKKKVPYKHCMLSRKVLASRKMIEDLRLYLKLL